MTKRVCIFVIVLFLGGCGKDKALIEQEQEFISSHHCLIAGESQSPTGEVLTKYSCDAGYQITTSNLDTTSDQRSQYYKEDESANTTNAAMTGAIVGSMMSSSGRK